MEQNQETVAQSGDLVEVDDLMKDLIPAFMQRRLGEIPLMENLYMTDDFTGLSHFGHKLKGTSLNYHFNKLASLATELEEAAEHKDKPHIRNIIDQISFHTRNVRIVFVEQ